MSATAEAIYSDIDPLLPVAQEACKLREKAVKARKRAGIDRFIRLAREQYQGIDEANRTPELEGARTLDGPLTTLRNVQRDEDRSSVFLNITRPFTDAATARIADIYLPTGKQPWQLRLTPVSDMETLRSLLIQYPASGDVLTRHPELLRRVNQPRAEAEKAMAVSDRTIRDWFKETAWLGEMRKIIEEAGQVGTAILKGPLPRARRLSQDIKAFLEDLPEEIRLELELRLKYTPYSEMVKIENFYPDGACGTDIQRGEFLFEKIPDFGKRQLKALADDPTYFPEQIALCLEEGPRESDLNGSKKTKEDSNFDLWVMHGQVPQLALDMLRDPGFCPLPEEMEECPKVFGTLTLCNNRVIRVARHALDSTDFPYDVLVWKPRENSWTGIGVPEEIETPQRGLNAAVRGLHDNLGYSIGPQVIEIQNMIEPLEGSNKLRPYKRWIAKIDGVINTIDDVKKAMQFLEFPNYTPAIMPVIEFWLKMAENTSALPLILQGQASTEAVGVSQQLQNNATTNLRLIIKAIDTAVVEPHLRRYYEWVQMYGPPEGKGDAVPEAIGSSTLLVRELQQQALLQVLDRFLQPVFGKSPKKGMDAFLEGQQLDPEKFDLDPEEKERLEAAESQPDPSVQVAQLEADASKYSTDRRAEVDLKELEFKYQKANLDASTAEDASATNASAAVATESLRQEGALEREQLKAGQKPLAKPGGRVPEPEPEMSPDEALSTLGF